MKRDRSISSVKLVRLSKWESFGFEDCIDNGLKIRKNQVKCVSNRGKLLFIKYDNFRERILTLK